MDFNARRRRVHIPVGEDDNSRIYQHDLNLYKNIPNTKIQLLEFEQLALERVKLFRIIEHSLLKGTKVFTDDWKNALKEELVRENLKKYVRLFSGYNGKSEIDFQARRADHISHYILRLAYCRSEILRRWFLARELEWFKIKFIAQSPQGIIKFLEINKLAYEPISFEEKETIKECLMQCIPGTTDAMVATRDYYKVPFTDVLPLVRSRRTYLKKGFAYIPLSDLVVCIQSQFRAILSESLNKINRNLPFIDDDRFSDLLNDLHNVHTGKDYTVTTNTDEIDTADLDALSLKQYPLCMRHLHEMLRANHHLRHFGRLTYGLFLKAIGVLYEPFIEFWRKELTQTIDNDKFDKQYLYTFNHLYGKVGRMLDYSPYSCIKIIMSNVGPGEYHGCPFKHWDEAVLKSRLTEYGAPYKDIQDIIKFVKSGHYQLACTKYFESVNGHSPPTGINHPNQYFEESMALLKNKMKGGDNKK